MPWFYTVAYSLGFRPWETAAMREAERIAALFDREEREREQPYGRALDLGCGTGMHAVELARRGWQVVGVDIVAKAVRAARDRARQARVDLQVIQGDVTALRAAGIGTGFDLVLDFGCFHGLRDAERVAMGREVSWVVSPGATMLMIAWARGARRPLPRGASVAEIEAAFPGWTTISNEALPTLALPAALKHVEPRVYRLRCE